MLGTSKQIGQGVLDGGGAVLQGGKQGYGSTVAAVAQSDPIQLG
jgi:hypothetical protein